MKVWRCVTVLDTGTKENIPREKMCWNRMWRPEKVLDFSSSSSRSSSSSSQTLAQQRKKLQHTKKIKEQSEGHHHFGILWETTRQ